MLVQSFEAYTKVQHWLKTGSPAKLLGSWTAEHDTNKLLAYPFPVKQVGVATDVCGHA